MQALRDRSRSTVGEFNQVLWTLDRETAPPTVKIRIQPGLPTRITAVNIDLTGPLLADVSAAARAIAELRTGWRLPQGAIFQGLNFRSESVR